MGCIDFGESIKLLFFEGNQVVLLSAHAEQRLWKHTRVALKMDNHGWLVFTNSSSREAELKAAAAPKLQVNMS